MRRLEQRSAFTDAYRAATLARGWLGTSPIRPAPSGAPGVALWQSHCPPRTDPAPPAAGSVSASLSPRLFDGRRNRGDLGIRRWSGGDRDSLRTHRAAGAVSRTPGGHELLASRRRLSS